MRIRASSTPILERCPASGSIIGEESIPVGRYVPAAALGSGVHKAMEHIVRGEIPNLNSIGTAWNCDIRELGILVGWGARLWNILKPRIANAQIEQELEAQIAPDAYLTGHADVWGYLNDGSAVIVDWKSGRGEGDHSAQYASYALLVHLMTGIERVTTVGVYLREQTYITQEYSAESLLAWRDRLVDLLRDDQFVPGEHCHFCTRRHLCPARSALIASVSADLTIEGDKPTISAESIAAMEPEDRGRLYAGVKMVLDVARTAEEEFKQAARQSGPLSLGNGKQLEEVEERHESIRAVDAWDEITSAVLPEDLPSVITVGKGKLLEAIARNSPRGKKGLMKKAFMDDLREKGAVDVITKTKVMCKREPQPVLEETDDE